MPDHGGRHFFSVRADSFIRLVAGWRDWIQCRSARVVLMPSRIQYVQLDNHHTTAV